jgi:hypothetical protein
MSVGASATTLLLLYLLHDKLYKVEAFFREHIFLPFPFLAEPKHIKKTG